MKTLLVHAYFIREDKTEEVVMRPYPPLGLLYVSGYLQKKGIAHEVFDGTFSSFNELIRFAEAEEPDLIAFYVNFLTRVKVIRVIDELQKITALKKMKVVLGGPDVRFHQKEYLNSGADFLVLGEGEHTLHELIETYNNQGDPAAVAGLVYTDNSGKIISTGERNHIPNLDVLPFPNRGKVDLPRYMETWKHHHGYSSITINTQRGCPYTCRWCSHAVFGDTYRRRSPKNVVDEIEHLVKTYNPDTFWFVDDVFTMSEKWIREFEEEIQKRMISISYECITRADRLNDNLLRSLKNTGCRLLWIGAESGSQHVIDLMDRRVQVQKVREMIQKAKELGMETGTFIMLGYPGETIADITETIKYLRESRPDHFTVNLAYPIKGTNLYDEVEHKITTGKSWPEPTDRDIDFQRTYRRSFYNFAIRKIYNEVHADRFSDKGNTVRSLISRMKALAASVGMQILK